MNDKLNILKYIHIALATGLCLAYLFLGNLTQPEAWKLPQFEQNTVIYLAIPLVAMVLSNVVFKLQLKNIPPKHLLKKLFLFIKQLPSCAGQYWKAEPF